MKFLGKITVEGENRRNRKTLKLLFAEQGVMKPLRGQNWLRDSNWQIQKIVQAAKENQLFRKEQDNSEILKTFQKEPNLKGYQN